MSTTLSNYLGDSVSRLTSTFTLERYGPCVLAQHIDDGKYVVLVAVETWIRISMISACHRSSYPWTMTRLRGKFLLARTCNSFTNCCFSVLFFFLDIIRSQCMTHKWWKDSMHLIYSMRWVFTCTLFWSVVIFFSIFSIQLIFESLRVLLHII